MRMKGGSKLCALYRNTCFFPDDKVRKLTMMVYGACCGPLLALPASMAPGDAPAALSTECGWTAARKEWKEGGREGGGNLLMTDREDRNDGGERKEKRKRRMLSLPPYLSTTLLHFRLILTVCWQCVHKHLLHHPEPHLLIDVHEHVMSAILSLILPHPQLLFLITMATMVKATIVSYACVYTNSALDLYHSSSQK